MFEAIKDTLEKIQEQIVNEAPANDTSIMIEAAMHDLNSEYCKEINNILEKIFAEANKIIDLGADLESAYKEYSNLRKDPTMQLQPWNIYIHNDLPEIINLQEKIKKAFGMGSDYIGLPTIKGIALYLKKTSAEMEQ